VAVDYSLEVAPETAARELTQEEIAQLNDYQDFYPVYLKHQKAVLVRHLDAKLDGSPLAFSCVRSSADASANIYTFRFTAPWELEPGRMHSFSFFDGNYEQDNFSGMRLTLTADDSVTLENVVAPDEALMAKPGGERGPKEGDQLRAAKADVRIGGPTAAAPRDQSPTTTSKPAASEPLLSLLLDTRQGFALLLVLAAGFGAVHALTPGHGKTLVAAYLVGERGTIGHAVLLGVTTTLTHTTAVLVVAGLLPLFFHDAPPAEVQRILELTGGLLVAALGVFLLQRRLTGGHDHIHIGGGHHHHHHSHDHEPHVHDAAPGAVVVTPPGKVGLWRLIVLGVSGGIVPCWDAIAMLGLAISAGRLWLGLPLLLAFSAGLAGVLVAIGVGVVCARNFAGKRWGGMDRFRPVIRALPFVSAAFITAMGLWLCYTSLHPG
jgi:ABC-type nickel/cobalt efflux system permease component RcnA